MYRQIQVLGNLFFIIILCVPEVVQGRWFAGPANYDECIIEAMEGVTSDEAAKEIKRACRNKFPVKMAVPRDLASADLRELIGKAWIENGRMLVVRIYNGSERIIKSIIVRIKPDNGGRSYDYALTFPLLMPKTIGKTAIEIMEWPKGAGLEWQIVSAKGF